MTPSAPIALCLIVKDGVRTLERCLDSIRPFVAEVNVYDTGSTDGTLELLKRIASEPGSPVRVERGEWRQDFSWARSQSFAMASPEIPWRMYLDADDEVIAGDRLVEVVREMERTNAYGALSAYYYDYAKSGDTGEASSFFRIMRAGSGSWRGVVHEQFVFCDEIRRGRQSERIPGLVVAGPPFRVLHHRHEHDTTRYMPLMREAEHDHERTPRASYFIAGTLTAAGDHAGALEASQRYLETVDGDEGPWSELRSCTLSYVVGAAAELGLDDLAVSTAEEIVDYLGRWIQAASLDPENISSPAFGDVAGKGTTDESVLEQAREILANTRELASVRKRRSELEASRITYRASVRPGRNEPCSCGSGVKAKRCCFA